MGRNLSEIDNLTEDSESGNPLRDGAPRAGQIQEGSMELSGIVNAVMGLGDVIQGLEAALGAALERARDLEVENAVLLKQQQDAPGDFGVFQWVYDGIHRIVHVTGMKCSKDLTPLVFGWELIRGAEDHHPPLFKCYDARKIHDMYQRAPAREMVA